MRRVRVVLAVVAGVSGLAAGQAGAGGLPQPATMLGGVPAVPVLDPAGQRSTPAERRRSRTAFEGLSPAQALSVARQEQQPLLVEPLWQAPVLDHGERIERFDSPNSALVAVADSGVPSRVEALGAPMAAGPVPGRAAAEDLRPVDLSLHRASGGWRPVRSAVATTLPLDASGRISVGDVLSVGLGHAGNPADGVSTAETKLFYPEVAADTDAVVEPLPDGVSVSWVVRSAAAPQRLPLDIEGARPAATVRSDGSLTLHDADGLAGTVSPPRAWDADGTAIPARIVVAGAAVEVVVEHRERDVRYPIAVDPVIRPVGQLPAVVEQDDDHGAPPRPSMEGWLHHTFQPALFQFYEDSAQKTITTIGSGDGSAWFTFDPIRNSAPYKAQFANVQLVQQGPGSRTCQRVGIVNPEIAADWGASAIHRYWTGSYAAGGATPWNTTPIPPATSQASGPYLDCVGRASQSFVEVCATVSCGPVGPANSLVAFQLNGVQVQPGAWSWAQMSGAYIFHRENVPPTVTATPNWTAAEWDAFEDDLTVEVTAHDDGVGLCGDAAQGFPAVVVLEDSLLGGTPLASAGNDGCTGMTYVQPAPSDQSYTVSVPADEVPEGRRTLTLRTVDAVGNATSSSLLARVDRSGPELALSGSLYVDRATEVVPADPPRPLTVAATDGSPGGGPDAQRSGVQRVEVYVDDELVHEADQTVAGDSQPLSTTWTPDAETFTSAEYTVEVVVTDRVGNESSESFVVKAPCCGVPLEDDTVEILDRLHALGDVDGDGQADVVLVDPGTGGITVRVGRGDGTFAAAVSWGTFGAAVDKIAVGEVDGETPDGPAEALTAPAGSDVVGRLTSGELVTLLSDGEAFAAGSTSGLTGLQTTWPADRSLGLADIDGDGADDVWGIDAATGSLQIGYSFGPAFEATSQWSVIPATRDVQMADLDGDGLADLVTYEPSDGVVRFHQSEGDGFAPTATWGQGPQDADLQTGDVNGDGLDDAIFRDTSVGAPSPAPVTARISSRNEGFVSGTRSLGTLGATYTLNAADLTGEGREDVVGLRTQGTSLFVRSIGSDVPMVDEPDPTEADPDQPDDEGTALARAGSSSERKAQLYMSDDNALRYGIGLTDSGDTGRKALLDRMKYLGATGVRTVVYWGKVDRLRPADDAALVLAPEEPAQPAVAPMGKNGQPQSETNRPDSARKFVLARDLGSSESLAGTVDDPEPEWINNEWRIVKNRYFVADIDHALGLVKGKQMTAHVTITGSTQPWFECKESEEPRRIALQVRGCSVPGDAAVATGFNPAPKRAGHAIASIAQHLRTTHGTTMASLGVWNEPNLDRGTFLSRTNAKAKRDTSVLYGQIYAYTWENLGRRSLLSGSGRLRVGFGEISSARTVNGGESGTLHELWPDQYVKRALEAARDTPGVAWPSGRVRADFLAIHPYQPTSAPWGRSPKYPWGVQHVGVPLEYSKKDKEKTSRKVIPSVKGFLSANRQNLFRKQGATAATAPEIWATEFGYFNVKGVGEDKNGNYKKVNYKSVNLTHGHGERERARYMTNNGGTAHGALRALSVKGNVKMIALWEVLEDPLAQIEPGLKEKGTVDDYGFIGRGGTYGDPDGIPDHPTHPKDPEHSYTLRTPPDPPAPDKSWPGQARYQNQMFRLTGTRVYGKAPAKRPSKFATSDPLGALKKNRYNGLQWPQKRMVGCEIRKWRLRKKC